MLGLIDDILISNAGVSEADLKEAAAAFNASQPIVRVIADAGLTDTERKIIFDSQHTYRGDHSDYVLRSTMTRVWYKDEDVPARHTVPIHKGDVLVMNNEYAQYKAETQIALQNLENNGRVNVVGHVAPTDMMLLETLQPWSDFRMIEGSGTRAALED